MGIASQTLSALKRLAIVVAVVAAFLFGAATTVYLSLRSSEVSVPDVVGKDRFVAENQLRSAGLNFRVRAIRPSSQVKADSVLFQLPPAGQIVKAGQTVAVDVSRLTKEGEASETVSSDSNTNRNKANDNGSDSGSASAGNSNENKPKRNKNTNTNATANANANANAIGNTNSENRNANVNRPRPAANANIINANTNAAGNSNSRANTNRSVPNDNANSTRPSHNVNRSPTPAEPPRK